MEWEREFYGGKAASVCSTSLPPSLSLWRRSQPPRSFSPTPSEDWQWPLLQTDSKSSKREREKEVFKIQQEREREREDFKTMHVCVS